MRAPARPTVAGLAVLAVLFTGCAGAPRGGRERRPPDGLELLGAAAIPSGTEVDGAVVGGLSGIAFAGDGRYLVVSDDKGSFGPPRVFNITAEIGPDGFGAGGPAVEGFTVLRQEDGRPLPLGSLDMEGIALARDGTFYVASEGNVAAGASPWIAHFQGDGTRLSTLPLPPKLLSVGDPPRGVRQNLALESLTLTSDGRHLFTATENALAQDGPEAAAGRPSPARILRYDLLAGRVDREFIYLVDAAPPAATPGGFHTAGLSDLAVLDDGRLLALERAFAAGRGFRVRLYLVDLTTAEDVSRLPDLHEQPEVRPAEKHLLLDLGTLGVRLDNLEGLALGATLPDGRPTLLLVSDDNFRADEQTNQFLVLALPRL